MSGFRSSGRSMALALLAAALLFGGLYAWRAVRSAGPAQGAPPPVTVSAIRVDPRDAPATLEAVGSLRAVREVMLAPEVAGRVVGLQLEAGRSVAAGTTLVQLYDAPERADRAAAVAQARFADIQLARSVQLAPTGAEPRETLEQRRAQADQAHAAVRQLDARIAQKRIAAPFAGEVGIRRINLGQYLNPGDVVASLTSLDRLYVDFTLPQQELARVRPGGTVSVTTDAWPGRVFTARVNVVEPQIGADTRNVSVQAELANADHALRPGMAVTAALALPPERAVLIVPTTALVTSASGDSVIAVRGGRGGDGGKAEPVAVITGRRIGDRVIVTSGLKPGDIVVTEGQLRVQPGATVHIAPAGTAGGR